MIANTKMWSLQIKRIYKLFGVLQKNDSLFLDLRMLYSSPVYTHLTIVNYNNFTENNSR